MLKPQVASKQSEKVCSEICGARVLGDQAHDANGDRTMDG